MCSECVQSVFRVCLECAQGAFRVCSECVQSAFSVCSECVQSVFNIDVISSPSASSVSIFGIFLLETRHLSVYALPLIVETPNFWEWNLSARGGNHSLKCLMSFSARIKLKKLLNK